MSKTKIIPFKEAIKKSESYNKRHLLLGNGFSIACVPNIFTYRSLYDKANFSKMLQVPKLFEVFKTRDFEYVIKALEISSNVIPAYLKDCDKTKALMKDQADKLKELLLETIAENHPAYPGDISNSKYDDCVTFLSAFVNKKKEGRIYTLNYDLLLYWALMYGIENKKFDVEINDGFGRNAEYDNGEWNVSDFVTWQGEGSAHNQNIHYLHGALHIFDKGVDIQKFTWIDTGERLIDQTRTALKENMFPLFVAEGESEKKMKKIVHSGYLYHSFKSFSAVMKCGKRNNSCCLFTYGVSFGSNDNHIFKKITEGNINKIFVGIYGDIASERNKSIIKEVETISNKRKYSKLEIEYYDAKSAKVWG